MKDSAREQIASLGVKSLITRAILFIGLVAAAITIYQAFFADSYPRLEYEILTSTPVLDVRENLDKLTILFDGIDVRQQQQALRVVTIRIINKSSKPILKTYYDENEPLGLEISTGEIVRADVLETSTDYLRKQVLPRKVSDKKLLFQSVILESEEYFVVKLLLLHPEAEEPTILPIGKIAGVKMIHVEKLYLQPPDVPFWGKALAGNPLIQGIRLLLYTLFMVLMFLTVLIPTVMLSSKIEVRKRRKISELFRLGSGLPPSEKFARIFEMYEDGQIVILKSINDLLSKQDVLDSLFALYKTQSAAGVDFFESQEFAYPTLEILNYRRRIRTCLEVGLVEEVDDKLVIDNDLAEYFEKFMTFIIKRKGEYPRHVVRRV